MTKEYIENNGLILNEYSLVIQPNDDTSEKINAIKKSFAKNYECPQAFHSKPHITLLKFTQCGINEQNIVGKIKQIVQQNPPIQIKINGFGSLPTHTIYANVETKNSFVEMGKSLKPIQSFLKLDKENKPHFITEPYIIIARKLLPWQFEKAWLEYSNTHFTKGFIVNDVVLLKRPTTDKGFSVAARFELLNKQRIVVEQASLFI
jgi:2'-5' RNA ligase